MHRIGWCETRKSIMFNVNNVPAQTIAKIAAMTAGSFEHGKAIADAIMQKPALKVGAKVTVRGKVCRVVAIAANGVWVTRTATEAEYLRKGVDQVRERVSAKDICA